MSYPYQKICPSCNSPMSSASSDAYCSICPTPTKEQTESAGAYSKILNNPAIRPLVQA